MPSPTKSSVRRRSRMMLVSTRNKHKKTTTRGILLFVFQSPVMLILVILSLMGFVFHHLASTAPTGIHSTSTPIISVNNNNNVIGGGDEHDRLYKSNIHNTNHSFPRLTLDHFEHHSNLPESFEFLKDALLLTNQEGEYNNNSNKSNSKNPLESDVVDLSYCDLSRVDWTNFTMWCRNAYESSFETLKQKYSKQQQEQQQQEEISPTNSTKSKLFRRSFRLKSRLSKSLWEAPMSNFDKWIVNHGSELRNFILSALIFFAIPNLYLLGGMQLHFSVTLTAGLFGFACLLSFLIFIAIFYYSSFGSPTEEWCHKEFVAKNKYEHLGLPLIDIVVLGIGQVTLLVLYCWSLADAGSPNFSNSREYTFYLLGILMQVAYGHDKKIWKSVYHHALFWISTLRTLRKADDEYEGYITATMNDSETMFSLRENSHLYMRFLISSFVNVTGLFIIMMGLPLQVATEQVPLDFVLNVVAGFYIVEWDDLDEGEEVKFQCVAKEDYLASLHSVGKESEDFFNDDSYVTGMSSSTMKLPRSRLLDLVTPATPTTSLNLGVGYSGDISQSSDEYVRDRIDRLAEEFTALHRTVEARSDELAKLTEHLHQLGKEISDLNAEANPPVLGNNFTTDRPSAAESKTSGIKKIVSFRDHKGERE
mmetsp:Transcript_17449/g.24532  ORF Transcript_17449/g.24532 Transcript_17449/m.24532 type:complete len:648 (-) Transcript_17449:50-1993(-)